MPDKTFMIQLSSEEIANYRKLFPIVQKWTYLNHAGVAPISARVWDAILEIGQEALHDGYTVRTQWHERCEGVRERVARFIGAKSTEIAFLRNTSHGISLIARGLEFNSGDEIILSEVEFPSNVYPWMALEKRGIILKKISERQGELQLDELERLITPRTRLIALSSVQYGSGFRLPITEIGSLCRKHGIYFFLDAIQSLGAFPLEVARAQVDFLSADAHKWLLGQEGIGILYIRESLIPKVEPVLLGWNSVRQPFNFDEIDFNLSDSAQRFEEGSANVMSIVGMGAAFDLLAEIGVARVSERILALTDHLIAGLKDLNCVITCSLNPKFRSGIVTFQGPGADASRLNELERYLFEKNIYVSVRRGNLRVSPHFYNTEDELENLLKQIGDFFR